MPGSDVSGIPEVTSGSHFFHVAGNFHWTPEDIAKSIVCMMMSGPFLTGYTQVLFSGYKLDNTFD